MPILITPAVMAADFRVLRARSTAESLLALAGLWVVALALAPIARAATFHIDPAGITASDAGQRVTPILRPSLAIRATDADVWLTTGSVHEIGDQRQGGNYGVPLEIVNEGHSPARVHVQTLCAVPGLWSIEGSAEADLMPGEAMQLRVVLDTSRAMELVPECVVRALSTDGTGAGAAATTTIRASAIRAETEWPSARAVRFEQPVGSAGPDNTVPSWYPDPSPVELRKPAANFINPPGTMIGLLVPAQGTIVSALDLGVHAAAEGGIATVEFYVRGETFLVSQEVLVPTIATQADGVIGAAPGYSIRLEGSSFGPGPDFEHLEVYARVWANDPTMLPRVIGPWRGVIARLTPPIEFIEASPKGYASELDPPQALWRRLLEISNNPPPTPVVFLLGDGKHVLPTANRSINVESATQPGVFSKVVLGDFTDFNWPIVINGTSENARLVASVNDNNGASAYNGVGRTCAPRVAFEGVTFDQSMMMQLYCQGPAAVVGTDIAHEAVFLGCRFLDSNGRYALYNSDRTPATLPTHAGRAPTWAVARGGVTKLYFSDCLFGDQEITSATSESIHKGINDAELIVSCSLRGLSGDAIDNAQAVLDCRIEDINCQPHRRDLPIGTLTYTGPAPVGIARIERRGANGQGFSIPMSFQGKEALGYEGAILLFEGPLENSPPRHIIALDGTPVGLIKTPVGWTNTSRHSVSTVAQFSALFKGGTIANWSLSTPAPAVCSMGVHPNYQPSGCSGPSPWPDGRNNRAAVYITRACQSGSGAFPLKAGSCPEPDVVSASLTTSIDVHADVLQWFVGRGAATGAEPTTLEGIAIDNRTYWGIAYDYAQTPTSQPAFPCYSCTGTTSPCPATRYCSPRVPNDPDLRVYEYAQGLLVNSVPAGVFNSSLRAIRLHMREDLSHTAPASQIGAPMSNVLITNLTLTGQMLVLRDSQANVPETRFVPTRFVLRDSVLHALVMDSVSNDVQCQSATLSPATHELMKKLDLLLVSNCHFQTVCSDSLTKSASSAQGCPPQGSMFKPVGPGAATYAAVGVNNGGRASWGHDPLLDGQGRPVTSFPLFATPLHRRTTTPSCRYFLDGTQITPCSPIGAMPIAQ